MGILVLVRTDAVLIKEPSFIFPELGLRIARSPDSFSLTNDADYGSDEPIEYFFANAFFFRIRQ